MSEMWPEDERPVPVDDGDDQSPVVDPDLADAEVHAEYPLELDPEDLRGDLPGDLT